MLGQNKKLATAFQQSMQQQSGLPLLGCDADTKDSGRWDDMRRARLEDATSATANGLWRQCELCPHAVCGAG